MQSLVFPWLLVLAAFGFIVSKAEEPGFAQGPSITRDFEVRQWTVEHGLPDNRVYCLVQSRDGYLWIGTRNGLIRFDGVRFTHFNRGNAQGLPENEIHQLTEDREGVLWINGRKTHLTTLRAGNLEEAVAVNREPIRGVLCGPSPRGGTWVSLESGPHLTRWGEGVARERWPLRFGINVAVAESKEGALWVAEPGQLRRRVGDVWRDFEIPPALDAIATTCVFAQGPTDLWFFHGESRQASRLYRLTADGPLLVSDQLPTHDNRSRLFAATSDGSLWLLDSYRGLTRLRGSHQVRYSLPWVRSQDYALCLLEDREGNLWVGTEYSGLFRLRPKTVQVVGLADGLPNENVRCVLADPEGRVWAGTDAGVALLTSMPSDPLGRPTLAGDAAPVAPPPRFEARSQLPPPLEEFSVRSLAPARPAGMWVGTSRGLFHLHEHGFLPKPLPVLSHPLDREGLAGSKQRALILGRSNLLWVATPTVVSVLAGVEANPRPVGVFKYTHSHTAVLEDRSGNVWMATDGAGVAVLPAASIARFLADPPRFGSTHLSVQDFSNDPLGHSIPDARWLAVTNGLPSDHAWELYEARDGAIWIATERGLARVRPGFGDGGESGISVFTAAQGLPDPQVNSIIEDDHGRVWFGTDTGIFHVRHQDLLAVGSGLAKSVNATTYGEADALLSTETNGRISRPGVCKTPDGRLWFATTKGVAVFDPARLATFEQVPPMAALEEVVADGEVIFAHASLGNVARGTRARPRAEDERTTPPSNPGENRHWFPLPPGRGRIIEFHFTGLSFAAPEKCRFRYRLEGYDEPGSWNESGELRTARYTNLDPGKYRFEVMVQDHRNMLSEVPAIYSFRLQPWFWQTDWFRATGAIALIGGISLAARYRERRKSNRLREQEREALRADMHDALGARLNEIQCALVVPTPDGGLPREQLSNSLHDASTTLRDILFLTRNEGALFSEVLRRLELQARRLFRPTGVAFSMKALDSDCELSPAVTHALLFAAGEALNNAAKHSQASGVCITASVGFREVELRVEDDGIGFAAELPATSDGEPHLGLGNMHERMRKVRGSCQVTSRLGHGTCITFRVPRMRRGSWWTWGRDR